MVEVYEDVKRWKMEDASVEVWKSANVWKYRNCLGTARSMFTKWLVHRTKCFWNITCSQTKFGVVFKKCIHKSLWISYVHDTSTTTATSAHTFRSVEGGMGAEECLCEGEQT